MMRDMDEKLTQDIQLAQAADACNAVIDRVQQPSTLR